MLIKIHGQILDSHFRQGFVTFSYRPEINPANKQSNHSNQMGMFDQAVKLSQVEQRVIVTAT